jgi:hypothetical protein
MIPSRTVIMRIAEPRPRRPVLGDTPMGQRVHEPEHFFRCKVCQRLGRCAGFDLG